MPCLWVLAPGAPRETIKVFTGLRSHLKAQRGTSHCPAHSCDCQSSCPRWLSGGDPVSGCRQRPPVPLTPGSCQRAGGKAAWQALGANVVVMRYHLCLFVRVMLEARLQETRSRSQDPGDPPESAHHSPPLAPRGSTLTPVSHPSKCLTPFKHRSKSQTLLSKGSPGPTQPRRLINSIPGA